MFYIIQVVDWRGCKRLKNLTSNLYGLWKGVLTRAGNTLEYGVILGNNGVFSQQPPASAILGGYVLLLALLSVSYTTPQ